MGEKENFEMTMPGRNQALMNATLVASTAADVDLDSLYVNSVVHSIRAEGTGGAARGKLWESLHRALLGVRSSKAVLQAVANAGGTALAGDVLKDETRALFHSLRDECANFGNWNNVSTRSTSETPALSPRSALMSVTSLPAIVPSPINSNKMNIAPVTTSEDMLDAVLGATPSENVTSAIDPNQPHIKTWSSAERHELASQLLYCLRDLGVLKASALPSVERQLRKFLANLALMSIEPCDRPCLDAKDVSNLLIESILTNSRFLPLNFKELDRLSEWRTSRVTWMAIHDVLAKWTRNRGNRNLKERSRTDRDAFYLDSDTCGRRRERKRTRERSKRRGRKAGQQDLKVWFCCAPACDVQNLQKSLRERKMLEATDFNKTVQNAESAADRLLHRLAVTAVKLSPIQAKASRDMVKTRGWQTEVL